MSDMHFTLRTEGDSPARKATAIGLGTFIGCVPLYGLHLILCASLARLFRLNRLITYLASHINNPFTAPWLLFVSLGVGHRFFHGQWPPPRLADLVQLGPLSLGRDLLAGSLLLGVVMGTALGTIAFLISRRARRSPRWSRLVEETGRRYFEAGISHWEFVRCKLRYDPLYRHLLGRLEALRAGSLLDLGCGRGIAMAIAEVVRESQEAADPVLYHTLIGVDRNPELVKVSGIAIGKNARIEIADLAEYDPPSSEVVLLLDVLHCLNPLAQERILELVSSVVPPGGHVLIREPDAALGMRFWLTSILNRACAVARGERRQGFHYRSREEWVRRLEELGLETSWRASWEGTPFANVLIEARKPMAPRISPA